MYIYLNNSNLSSADFKSDPEGKITMLANNDAAVLVSNADQFPFVKLNGAPVESAINNSVIRKHFLKAVIQMVPALPKREYGVYHHGNAKAEFISNNGKQKLTIECDQLDSLRDIAELQKMFMAGTILPTISYEKKQVKAPNILTRLISKIKR